MVPQFPNGLAVFFLNYAGLTGNKAAAYATQPQFPFADFWWLYVVLIVFMLILLTLDMELFHLKAQTPTGREAILWMGVSGMFVLALVSAC